MNEHLACFAQYRKYKWQFCNLGKDATKPNDDALNYLTNTINTTNSIEEGKITITNFTAFEKIILIFITGCNN